MKPGYQIPPLLKILNTEYPYSVWIEMCSTPEEYFYLHQMFLVLPKKWIEWVEKEVFNKTKRGIIIRKPLAYRQSFLWNGIINLEEVKFILDIFENSLRKIFLEFLENNFSFFNSLKQTIPKLSEKAENLTGWEFVIELSFYQLTETMYRNWFKIKSTSFKFGFFDYFGEKRLKDKEMFRLEMKKLRKKRNEIAHTKKLFTEEEVKEVLSLANKWLTPLGVDIKHYVDRYRTFRPNYLKNFDSYLDYLSKIR